MGYTIEQVKNIAAKLHELPPIDRKNREVNKQAAVLLLAKEITALRKRGYALDQIAGALRNEGLDITTPVLKNSLQRAKPKKKIDTPPAAARPAATSRVAESSRAGFTVRPDTDDI